MNICVLKSGGEFLPKHVYRLSEQVPDLICLSDINIKGIETIPMANNWPKWWSKLELFNPLIKGDLMYFDLDTLVINVPVSPNVTTVLTDFGDNNVIASGLMFLKEADRINVWNEWIKSPESHMKAHIKWPAGDGGFLNRFYNKCQRWQDINKVYSWKYHCAKGIPADADIVCFHGNPRPWQIGL